MTEIIYRSFVYFIEIHSHECFRFVIKDSTRFYIKVNFSLFHSRNLITFTICQVHCRCATDISKLKSCYQMLNVEWNEKTICIHRKAFQWRLELMLLPPDILENVIVTGNRNEKLNWSQEGILMLFTKREGKDLPTF